MAQMYVITGGPGTGKSTVIAELAKLGYQTVPEAARLVMEEEQNKLQPILPWTNLYEFQRRTIAKQLNLEAQLKSGIAFLDRGRRDCVGYCRKGRIDVPPEVTAALSTENYQYIFLMEPLCQYVTDQHRRETQEKALDLHHFIAAAYRDGGYLPITVPALSPSERVNYILCYIHQLHFTSYTQRNN